MHHAPVPTFQDTLGLDNGDSPRLLQQSPRKTTTQSWCAYILIRRQSYVHYMPRGTQELRIEAGAVSATGNAWRLRVMRRKEIRRGGFAPSGVVCKGHGQKFSGGLVGGSDRQ